MRLLVLGGTVFLGRAVARHARDAGHDVTCAARGRSGDPVEGVRFVTIDRAVPAGLAALDDERFDAVVDVGRIPSHMRTAVDALTGRVGHWVYVSTASVYSDAATVGQHVSTAPLLPPAERDLDETSSPEAYGSNKLACERILIAAVGADRCMLARAGLVVGPEDRTGRFDYWVRRMARGGEVLAPGHPADPVQCVDVRDLAAWLVEAAESGLAGVYDAVSAPMPRVDFLSGVAEGVGGTATLTWVSQDFLVGHGVQPWMGERSLPLWLPLPEYAGFMTRDTAPALAAGLRPRPIADTARDTLAWLADRPEATSRSGLAPDDEAELLRRWRDEPA
jgi:nucleoside-diphosphate-sugar epimerase